MRSHCPRTSSGSPCFFPFDKSLRRY